MHFENSTFDVNHELIDLGHRKWTGGHFCSKYWIYTDVNCQSVRQWTAVRKYLTVYSIFTWSQSSTIRVGSFSSHCVHKTGPFKQYNNGISSQHEWPSDITHRQTVSQVQGLYKATHYQQITHPWKSTSCRPYNVFYIQAKFQQDSHVSKTGDVHPPSPFLSLSQGHTHWSQLGL